MRRFPVNNLSGGAKIEGGRLVLESDGATLICTPNRFNCFEVPDVLKLGDKWYLIALTGDAYGQSKRMVDIYVDDVLVMDYYLAGLGDGGVSLVSREGICRFVEASYRAGKAASGRQTTINAR